ncbi:Uncharacterised protein [Mycobacterium tuberculosis]|nr:Uncharacterised protein [Mycobacterium tuberculosis]
MPAPRLWKPDNPPPPPMLKNPDDGTAVVLPMPGVGGMTNPALMGPSSALTSRTTGIRSMVISRGKAKAGVAPDNARPSGSWGMVISGLTKGPMVTDRGSSTWIGSTGMWNPGMVISGVRWVTPSELSSTVNGRISLGAVWMAGTLTLMNPSSVRLNGSMMEPELNIGPTVTPVAGSSPRAGIVMSWTVMGPRSKTGSMRTVIGEMDTGGMVKPPMWPVALRSKGIAGNWIDGTMMGPAPPDAWMFATVNSGMMVLV